MAAQSATTEIAGAKAYWETLPTDFPVYATLMINATQGSNCFVTLYKDTSYGRIEIMGISTGSKVVWKKGYSDSDFVLVS